jgi:hypothetical protein
MFLDTKNKNMHGLGVVISTVFDTRSKNIIIWFRGGDLNRFRDIQQLPFLVGGGGGMTPGAISNKLHILLVTQGT